MTGTNVRDRLGTYPRTYRYLLAFTALLLGGPERGARLHYEERRHQRQRHHDRWPRAVIAGSRAQSQRTGQQGTEWVGDQDHRGAMDPLQAAPFSPERKRRPGGKTSRLPNSHQRDGQRRPRGKGGPGARAILAPT